MSPADDADYIRWNRDTWDRQSDAYQERHARLLEEHEGRAWGVWRIPEADLRVLGDVQGLDVLELGCGAARWSIALSRMGAAPVSVDVSARQLEHARRAMATAEIRFPLIRASVERLPLADRSFDVVFSDHGAFAVADPTRVMTECARLLRDDGLLAFSNVSPILDLVDVNDESSGRRLRHDYFALDRLERWGTIAFHVSYGEWIRLFRANGFEILDLIEIRPAEWATTTFDLVPLDWARRWPAEVVWKARRRR
jgi:SAM-dependent methyltransferase